MKALTVQQPWAWAIIHGGKTVENRTTNWSYRGLLAIHAGQRMSDRGIDSSLIREAANQAGWDSEDGAGYLALLTTVDQGAIIGTVDLIDVHPASGCCEPWGERSYVEHGGMKRVDIFHLVLEHPVPYAEPIPCSGRLGLWTVPDHVAAELEPAFR